MKTSVAGYRLSIAMRYWHSARIILANQIRQSEFLEPLGFLLGMATELALKAYLLDTGVTEKALASKKMGHDLRALLRECIRASLEIAPNEASCILNMREAHFTHFNRYGAPADEQGVPHGAVLLTNDEMALSQVAALLDRISGDPAKLRVRHGHPEKLDWPQTLPVLYPVDAEVVRRCGQSWALLLMAKHRRFLRLFERMSHGFPRHTAPRYVSYARSATAELEGSRPVPLCPSTSVEAPIKTYFEALYIGDIAVDGPYGETMIDDVTLHPDGNSILILGDFGEGAIKRWSLMKITFEDGCFVHESKGTFFERDGAEKQFTLAQGLPWEGGESIDDYC